MDTDLELVEDKLQKFLQSKLHEITIHNQKLQSTLLEYQAELNSKTTLGAIKIESLWKGVIHHKLVVGFEVFYPGDFEEVSVILNCDHLNYTVHTFTKQAESSIVSLDKTEKFTNSVIVTLCFVLAELIGEPVCHLQGFVCMTVNRETVTAPLPKVSLPINEAILQKPADVLAVISASTEVSLMVVLPEEWTTPTTNTLEINCLLTYNPSNGGYYTVNNIHPAFDGTVVVLSDQKPNDQTVILKVFAPNEEGLLLFVHHILSSIPGSAVLPDIFYTKFDLDKSQEYQRRECLRNFHQKLSRELKIGLQYHQCLQHHGGENSIWDAVREKLCEQESQTDLAYFRVLSLL